MPLCAHCNNPLQLLLLLQWYLGNGILVPSSNTDHHHPSYVQDPENFVRNPEPHQSVEEIRLLIDMARSVGKLHPTLAFNEDEYMDSDILEPEDPNASHMTAPGGGYMMDDN